MRKFRWTFEASDKNSNIVFRESFVRLDERPVAEENNGELKFLDGKIKIIQYFTMYEEKDKAKEEFDKFSNASQAITATLRLYDGIGDLLEEWKFEDVEMELDRENSIFEEGNIIPTWIVSYKKASYSSFSYCVKKS
jgi:hypothetical protein